MRGNGDMRSHVAPKPLVRHPLQRHKSREWPRSAARSWSPGMGRPARLGSGAAYKSRLGHRDTDRKGQPMSCPVSSCHRLLILIEDPLQRAVVGRVVDGVVLPAAPDDVDPGAGQDADGVLVVAFPGEGFGVEVGGPGVVETGVAGEITERIAELLVGSPAEGHCFDLAGLPGRRGDSGKVKAVTFRWGADKELRDALC